MPSASSSSSGPFSHAGLIGHLLAPVAMAAHVLRASPALHPDVRQADSGPRPLSLGAARPSAVDVVDGFGRTLLMHAANQGDLAGVEALLQDGARVYAVDVQGRTALSMAAHAGHADVAVALLRAGANPEALFTGGISPLMLAAHEGFDGVVAVLGAYGVNTEAVNQWGLTALMVAVSRGHIDVVHALLDAGANPNTQTQRGTTALQLAVDRGLAAIVDVLVKGGADIRPDGGIFSLILLRAALQEHRNVVDVLVEAGIDIDANLRFAALNDWVYSVNALVRFGADVNGVDDLGYTAMMRAAANGHVGAVNELLLAGANINARLPMPAQNAGAGGDQVLPGTAAGSHALTVDGFTAWMLAMINGHEAVALALIRAGADIAADMRMVQTRVRAGLETESADAAVLAPPAPAAPGSQSDNADALTPAEATAFPMADVHAPAPMQATPAGHAQFVNPLVAVGPELGIHLFGAAPSGSADRVTAIAQMGADVNGADANGSTALMVAVQHGHTDVVEALLGAGAAVNAVDSDGYTALMFAALMGNAAVARPLVRGGADIDVASVGGLTARGLAELAGHLDVVNCLQEADDARQATAAEAFAASVLVDECIPVGAAQAGQVSATVPQSHARAQMAWLVDMDHGRPLSAAVRDSVADESMDGMRADSLQRIELIGVAEPT